MCAAVGRYVDFLRILGGAGEAGDGGVEGLAGGVVGIGVEAADIFAESVEGELVVGDGVVGEVGPGGDGSGGGDEGGEDVAGGEASAIGCAGHADVDHFAAGVEGGFLDGDGADERIAGAKVADARPWCRRGWGMMALAEVQAVPEAGPRQMRQVPMTIWVGSFWSRRKVAG